MNKVGGVPAFLNPEQREKLAEIMRRNLYTNPRAAIGYCIDMVWMEQVGRFQDSGGDHD